MKFVNLKLINFKNYTNCSLNFNPRFNFIYGENGNGKTNLLEALSLLCFTKSFLQNSELDCLKNGENNFEINANVLSDINVLNKVEFKFNKDNQKKEIFLDNNSIQRFNNFFGTLPITVLSPYDLKLTSGLPIDKRRNFDILISQISKIYYNDLKDLAKIVKNKNSLLKENLLFKKYSSGKLYSLLEPWNEKLIEIGTRIISKRIEFFNEFKDYFYLEFNKIVNNNISPEIIYKSEIFDAIENDKIDIDKLKNDFINVLQNKNELEISRGVCLVGPHRDNYIFSIYKNGVNFEIKTFGSQGEHKTFLVALKIAEYNYLKDKINNSSIGQPVLLLDDLFSELDRNRTEKIASMLVDINQIFLTTTDYRYMDIIGKYFQKDDITSFYVANGTAQTN